MQAQLNQLETDYGIEWQEYQLDDLFEVSRGNIFNQKKLIPDSKGIAFIAQNDCNNGFVGKVQKQLHRVFKGNSLIIGRQTGVVYYQENDFITTDGVLVLSAIRNFIKNNYIGLFIASILSKKLGGSFGYTNTVSATKLNKITIQLPTIRQNGEAKIAFDFMEAFIATLKAERLATLKAYLTVTGLTNTTLTPAEQVTLKNLDALTWGTFRIGDLFEIKPTKNYGLSNNDLLHSKGVVPVVSNTSLNNGVTGYVDLEPTEKGNMITFSDTTTDESIFYQPNDFVGYSHIQGMYKKFPQEIGKNHYLFIVTSFRNAVRGKYNYGSKFNRENARKEKIQMPITDDGTPDYDTMNLVVSALQKVVILGVVSCLDDRIEKTGELV